MRMWCVAWQITGHGSSATSGHFVGERNLGILCHTCQRSFPWDFLSILSYLTSGRSGKDRARLFGNAVAIEGIKIWPLMSGE